MMMAHAVTTAPGSRGGLRLIGWQAQKLTRGCAGRVCQEFLVMQMMSAAEKAALEAKREELYKSKIDVQDRIRKAAALGDLSENAEYHFAKEENRSIERELATLELKLRHVQVVDTSDVPEDTVFLGHT